MLSRSARLRAIRQPWFRSQSWLPDATMQAIANENNLAETAFFVPHATGMGSLRSALVHAAVEVPLCGHATLASGWVVLNELAPSADMVRFETKSGELTVAREGERPAEDGASGQFRGPVLGAARRLLARSPSLQAVWRRKSSIGPPKAREEIPVWSRCGPRQHCADACHRRSCRCACERKARGFIATAKATASRTISSRASLRRAWACMRTR